MKHMVEMALNVENGKNRAKNVENGKNRAENVENGKNVKSFGNGNNDRIDCNG